MTNKFKNVPKMGIILDQNTMTLNDIEVLYQKWKWCEYTVESIIFEENDVSDMSDDDIIDFVSTSTLVKDKNEVVIVRDRQDYVYASLNIEEKDLF